MKELKTKSVIRKNVTNVSPVSGVKWYKFIVIIPPMDAIKAGFLGGETIEVTIREVEE